MKTSDTLTFFYLLTYLCLISSGTKIVVNFIYKDPSSKC